MGERGGGGGDGEEGENWEVGRLDRMKPLFYHSVMQHPIIVNKQFFLNHQFKLQY